MKGINARKRQLLDYANRQAAASNTIDNSKRTSNEHLVSIDVSDDIQGKEAFLQWGVLPIQGRLFWKLYRHPTRVQGFARAGCCGMVICRRGIPSERWVAANSVDALMEKVGTYRNDAFTSYQVVDSIK
jgi:hypothetical protein